MKTENKTLEFVQSSLRSASDIYKKGGHVTMNYRDQLFRMHFDNRRQIEWETTIPSTIEELMDSKPLENINQGQNLRFISKIAKTKLYGRYTSGKKLSNYKSKEEIVERNFLKGLLSKPPLFNLHRNELKRYKDIVEWLKEYNPKTKVTEDSLSYLKSKVSIKIMKVERTKECENFISFIKQRFKYFEDEEFFK
jgi:transposase